VIAEGRAARLGALVVALALAAGCAKSPSASIEPGYSLAVFPAPLYLDEPLEALPVTRACLDTRALPTHDAVDAAWPALLAAADLRAADEAACDLTVAFDPVAPPDLPPAARVAWETAGPDRYVVLGRLAGGRAVVRLYAENERAALYALGATLARMAYGRFHPAVIVDGSAIAERGIVEGHYGAPLTLEQRRCLIDAMVPLHHSVYFYTPKDDPYARQRWADPYPDADAAVLVDAAAAARAHRVDFMWGISPGLEQGYPAPGASISFASDTDFGIDRFALLLDDTVRDFVWDADRAAFPTLAAAHASLANRLEGWLGARGLGHLWFVGAYYSYHWDGWQPYVSDLGARLAPGVAVLWTGPEIYSPTISAADLADVNAALGRKVIIWDNKPEIDLPLEGRAGDLGAAIDGYVTNTVLLQRLFPFEAFWSVIGPSAAFAWNPAAYDRWAALTVWTARAGSCKAATP
jgi:hyaluronoglucosaminidase